MMKEDGERTNILSIESAVSGGSVALITAGGGALVRHEGNDCSRAEKLLPVISDILKEAGLTLRDTRMIAVSTGPGSYSGIRIGVSTALGLTTALDIPVAGVSVLAAMAYSEGSPDDLITAVPVGKNDVAWQSFEIAVDGNRRASTQPVLTSLSSFLEDLTSSPDSTLIAHTELLTRIAGTVPRSITCIDAGAGLAEYVGRYAASLNAPATPLHPIYLRNRDAVGRPGAF
jgi:tRNA threonylcarbamoyladenosine biosynthesis protein TsaB